ncbi:MAG: radical SAM protein [bacterium]
MKKRLLLVSFVGGFRSDRKLHRAMAPFTLVNFLKTDPQVALDTDAEIEIFDAADNDEVVLRNIRRRKPDVVGFTCFYWSVEKCLNVARKLKLVSPETITIAGGPQITELLFAKTPCLDFAARGEGEIVLREFMKALTTGGDPAKVRGLMYRKDGKAFTDSGQSFVENLDDLPPLSECVPLREAILSSFERKFPLETSRGCPNKCSYCNWNMHSVRFHSIINFERNLRFLMDSLPPRNKTIIDFTDSYLDINIKRLKDVLKLLIKYRKPGVEFRGYFLFNNLDAESIDLLDRANFRRLSLGLQALNPDVRQTLNRNWFDDESLERAISLQDRFQIMIDLLLGVPGDNSGNFKDTIARLWRRGANDITASVLRVLPGTRLYDNSDAGFVFDADPPHMVISSPSFSFADIHESGRFAMNFTVINNLLKRADIELIEKEFRADFFDICEDIHIAIPQWNGFITKIGEGASGVDANPDIILLLPEYLARLSPGNPAAPLIESIVKLRRSEFLLAESLEKTLNESPRNLPVPVSGLDSAKARVPRFEKITLRHNVFGLPGSKQWGAPFEEPKTFFIVNNYATHGYEILEPKMPEVAEILFKLLAKPATSKAIAEFAAESIKGVRRESVISFIKMLCEKSALVYRESAAPRDNIG